MVQSGRLPTEVLHVVTLTQEVGFVLVLIQSPL